jgi:hypothetical protein
MKWKSAQNSVTFDEAKMAEVVNVFAQTLSSMKLRDLIAVVDTLVADQVSADLVKLDKVKKSVDGPRTYDLSAVHANAAAGKLEAISEQWPWDDGLDSLIDKAEEELAELRAGDDTPPVMEGSSITVVGTSRQSESITGVVVAIKLARTLLGVSTSDVLKLAALRYEEQFERYRSK